MKLNISLVTLTAILFASSLWALAQPRPHPLAPSHKQWHQRVMVASLEAGDRP